MKITAKAYDPVELWLKKAIHSDLKQIPRYWTTTLMRFMKWIETTPDGLLEEWHKVRYDFKEREKFLDQLTELIENYYAIELEMYAPLSRNTMLNILRSFFRHHHIPIEPHITDRLYVKYHNRPIKKGEMRRILERSNLRDRVFFLMMLESGQRPNTLVRLRYKHIKEDFEGNRVPMKIDLPAEILKDKVGFRFTFIGKDCFKLLKEYLTSRLPLEDEDVIFKTHKQDDRAGEYLTMNAFSASFKRKVTKLGLAKKGIGDLRLYCLRKYFRNNIKVSDPAYRKFWMGRSFGTDEHYLTRDVEKHREVYARGYESLRIFQPETPQSIAELREYYEGELEKLRKDIKELSSKRVDPLLRDIETLTQLPGGRKYLTDIVSYAKERLQEIVEKEIR